MEQVLPEDVVAEVLGRLAPRSLAVARCVCKAWHAIVDSRRLLRADLLPHSLAGVLVEFNNLVHTEFFSPRPAAATISGDLTYTPGFNVLDHCNGLLLLDGCVANPATRQWARLPERYVVADETGVVDSYEGWLHRPDYSEFPYLVFDPAVSPHYEVVLVPGVRGSLSHHHLDDDDNLAKAEEWPPALYETHVFSSATGRWEERTFVREGNPAGTKAYLGQDRHLYYFRQNGVYWHGALYVHCQRNFFYRMSLEGGTYRVIHPPAGVTHDPIDQQVFLGRSKDGVSCAAIDRYFRLRVWTILDDHHDEWVLKHQNDLKHILLPSPAAVLQDDDWILEDINYHADGYVDQEPPAPPPPLREHSFLILLGFHPFQDIVFFNSSLQRGLAYDLNTSKVQDLGHMCPRGYGCTTGEHDDIRASFPYTPFWMQNSLPTVHLEDDAHSGQ